MTIRRSAPESAAGFAAVCLERLGRLPVVWICLLCLAPRTLLLWWTQPGAGRSNYWRAAEVLAGNAPHPQSTFLEPLYPLFLAGVRALGGDPVFALAVQVVLATFACWVLYRLTLRLSGEPAAAAIAGLLYAVHPYLVRQSTALIYLPLLIPLVLLALLSLLEIPGQPGAAVLFGLTAALALLTRTDFAPAALLLALWLLFRRGFRPLLTALATAALVLAPAILRNYSLDGSILPTRGGFDLLKGNCEYSDRLLPDYSLDLLNDYIHETLLREAPELEKAGDREKDRFYRRKALEFVREHPFGRFASSC